MNSGQMANDTMRELTRMEHELVHDLDGADLSDLYDMRVRDAIRGANYHTLEYILDHWEAVLGTRTPEIDLAEELCTGLREVKGLDHDDHSTSGEDVGDGEHDVLAESDGFVLKRKYIPEHAGVGKIFHVSANNSLANGKGKYGTWWVCLEDGVYEFVAAYKHNNGNKYAKGQNAGDITKILQDKYR